MHTMHTQNAHTVLMYAECAIYAFIRNEYDNYTVCTAVNAKNTCTRAEDTESSDHQQNRFHKLLRQSMQGMSLPGVLRCTIVKVSCLSARNSSLDQGQ